MHHKDSSRSLAADALNTAKNLEMHKKETKEMLQKWPIVRKTLIGTLEMQRVAASVTTVKLGRQSRYPE